MKYTYIFGASFMEFRLYFHKISFIFNILFSPLRETQLTGHLKRFAEASELFTHAEF